MVFVSDLIEPCFSFPKDDHGARGAQCGGMRMLFFENVNCVNWFSTSSHPPINRTVKDADDDTIVYRGQEGVAWGQTPQV